MLSSILVLSMMMVPGFARAEAEEVPAVEINGFVIIINDLVTVDDEGHLIKHETKLDAQLNIQAKVIGKIRVGEDGLLNFKQGQTLEFQKSLMFLSNEKTVPLTIEVLSSLLDEKEETQELPILIKAENDKTARRFDVRINSMRAGILLRPEDKH